MRSNSQNGYVVSASSIWDGGHNSCFAFDGNRMTRWASRGTGTEWIQIRLPSPALCNVVRIYSRGDGYLNQTPKTFSIQASTNGSNWVTLTSQTNVHWATCGEVHRYTFENETQYQYFRMVCTVNMGGVAHAISGLEFGWEPPV